MVHCIPNQAQSSAHWRHNNNIRSALNGITHCLSAPIFVFHLQTYETKVKYPFAAIMPLFQYNHLIH